MFIKLLREICYGNEMKSHLKNISIFVRALWYSNFVFLKFILKKFLFFRVIHQNFWSLNRELNQLGLFPIQLKRIKLIPRFFREKRLFSLNGGQITHSYPIITDYFDSAGTASGHYFHQDLLVAQYIFTDNPKYHVDVGSRIDGFIAHVASFREVEVLDIRELNKTNHSNIKFKQLDLMSEVPENYTDSLSCLHTIEHFGLGRYGDPIDPKGYIKGFNNLVKMVSPRGKLYISFPIGKFNEVHFNAHRVFHPTDIFLWAPGRINLINFDYVDDLGELHRNKALEINDISVNYGCGIYTFQKLTR